MSPVMPAIVSKIGLGMVIIALIEGLMIYLRHGKEAVNDTWSNIVVWAIGYILRAAALKGFLMTVLVLAAQLVPYSIPINLWTLPLLVLAADFTYYWKHYAEHRIRLYWCFHVVHHSSSEYNLSTSLRLPWIQATVNWVFFLPMIAVGFQPLHTMVSYELLLLYQFWIHTQRIGHLGWVEKVFNTPSNHRVHHGSNARYIDKNMGGLLVVWDRMFGTYEPETEPVRYGITTPVSTKNPFRINFDELLDLFADMRQAKSLRTALKTAFKGPEWKPPHKRKSGG